MPESYLVIYENNLDLVFNVYFAFVYISVAGAWLLSVLENHATALYLIRSWDGQLLTVGLEILLAMRIFWLLFVKEFWRVVRGAVELLLPLLILLRPHCRDWGKNGGGRGNGVYMICMVCIQWGVPCPEAYLTAAKGGKLCGETPTLLHASWLKIIFTCTPNADYSFTGLYDTLLAALYILSSGLGFSKDVGLCIGEKRESIGSISILKPDIHAHKQLLWKAGHWTKKHLRQFMLT